MYTFSIEAANQGKEDEHQVAVAIRLINDDMYRIVDQQVMRVPVFFGEDYADSYDGERTGWKARVEFRFETMFDLPCGCESHAECAWHSFLLTVWKEEDEDAIDSWRESRGDVDAMLRRTRRMILSQTSHLI